MADIPRIQEHELLSAEPRVPVVLYGTRRAGKTTLLRKCFLPDSKALWLSGESPKARQLLSVKTKEEVKDLT